MKAISLKDFGPVTNFVLDENVPIPVVGERQVLVKISDGSRNLQGAVTP